MHSFFQLSLSLRLSLAAVLHVPSCKLGATGGYKWSNEKRTETEGLRNASILLYLILHPVQPLAPVRNNTHVHAQETNYHSLQSFIPYYKREIPNSPRNAYFLSLSFVHIFVSKSGIFTLCTGWFTINSSNTKDPVFNISQIYATSSALLFFFFLFFSIFYELYLCT